MPDEEPLTRNWILEAPLERSMPERVVWWDETLRDGEQTPGVYYSLDEKVELAKLLDEVGVSVIHAGIPAISANEVASVRAVAQEGLEHASVIAGARTVRGDIDAVLKSDAPETAPFIACSNVHLRYKLKRTKEEAIEMAADTVEYAVDHGLRATFVTEDTVRADPAFVHDIYRAAIDAGASRVLFCDTVGVMAPPAVRWFYDNLRELGIPEGPVGGSPGAPEWGFHNHNDFGLATANALAAIESGVSCINCTVNGIGERAGNTAFEEVVMALETLYGYDTGIDTTKLVELSRRVEELTGIPVDQMKPVVGPNAFRHESGIHTHGVLSNTLTYEPMQPRDVGHERHFVFGKHTGTAAIADRLQRAGIAVDKGALLSIQDRIKTTIEARGKGEQETFVRDFRAWTDAHQGVSSDEFWEIVSGVTGKRPSLDTA